MFSLEIECDPDDRDLLIAELWEQGSAGIVDLDTGRVRAFFEDAADREALLQMYPGAGFRVEEPRDWVQSARDLLQPMEVGARFFLVPEWRDDLTPPGRFRITVNPAMAFGTGVHETTRTQGRRMTGGKWTRPDLTLLAVRSNSFVPGKRLEVVTFEVKPNLEQALEGVFEACAHSAFANLAFLV